MSTSEVNFSDLSNKPVETVKKLQRARTLRVHRRGAEEDLILTTVSRVEQNDAVASATTRMFLALMEHDDQALTLVTDVMPEAFPWVRFLPTHDVHAFVVELVDTLKAADAITNPAPVAELVTMWRHTAEIYADPELAEALRGNGHNHGLVQVPAGRE